jgi:hypothetical protein
MDRTGRPIPQGKSNGALCQCELDAPLEISIKPLFEMLGTDPRDKEQKVYKTDRIPPRNEYIKETLAWLDRYLGPVR